MLSNTIHVPGNSRFLCNDTINDNDGDDEDVSQDLTDILFLHAYIEDQANLHLKLCRAKSYSLK